MQFSSDPINTLENLYAKNKTKSISIYLVVELAIMVFLALLPVIKVDISSQSRRVVRSVTDNVPVTTVVSGKLTFCGIRNNAVVKKGDTLLKISPQVLEADNQLQNSVLGTSNQLRTDISKALADNFGSISSAAVRQEVMQFQSQQNELKSKLALAQTTFNRNKTLYDKGIIARAEFEKHEFDLKLVQQSLQSLISQQKASWQNQKRELDNQVKNINGTVAKIKTEKNNYFVLSPIDSTIENNSALQIGSFVNAGQSIANISPSNNLIVEYTVSPSDIDLIRNNQQVKFQFDAFNYNQWGLAEGNVYQINNNISFQDKNAFFVVRCKLNNKTLQLKSGYKAAIGTGMTLTTRYIITRRSLFELLFDKVDDWLNPKQLERTL